MNEVIRPFTCQVGDEVIAELKDRLARTRWPDQLPEARWDYGTEMTFLQRLCHFLQVWQAGLGALAGFLLVGVLLLATRRRAPAR